MTSPSIEQERTLILQQMAQIDHMIRGHLSQQSFKTKRQGKVIVQGPYHLLQRFEKGKNNCQRVPADQLPSIADAVLGHQRFQELAARYAALTEQMTWNAMAPDLKKKFRRFWPSIARNWRPS
jgi:hypothetical protein